MFTVWKRTTAVVCLALFIAITAISFSATVTQAAYCPDTRSCNRGPIYR